MYELVNYSTHLFKISLKFEIQMLMEKVLMNLVNFFNP